MDIYKHIKEATYQIELLKGRLGKTTNELHQRNLVNLINAFINLLNDCDFLLKYRLQTDVVDRLLLTVLRNYFMEACAAGENIPIHLIVNRIDNDLKDTKDFKQMEVVQLMKDIKLSQIVKQIPIVKGRSPLDTKIDTSKINDDKLKGVCSSILLIDEKDNDYNEMISQLLNEFKETIKWN